MTEAEIPQTENYTVEAILGKGGMGVVYLAFDKRLNRKVAIKCIRHNRANENWVEAVTEEARLLAQINHRNIVHIYDLIDWQGSPALVMEYLQGRTLLDIFRSDELMSGELDLATRLDWLRQIAEGLACAHAKGIIHRDLKAENIMITDEGTVKIMDFGIARHQAQPLHANIHDSQVLPGEFIGSPAALSPEQAMGDRLTTASDIFSFGILAYCLLCGHHPFGDPKNADLVLQGIIYRPPMPVQFLECLGVLDEDAQALGAEIIACLNKAPGMRPAADSFASQLKISNQDAAALVSQTPVEQKAPLRSGIFTLLLVVPLIAYGIFIAATNQPTKHVAILPPTLLTIEDADYKLQSLAATAFTDTLYQRLLTEPGITLADASEFNTKTTLAQAFEISGATHAYSPSLACSSISCSLTLTLYSSGDGKNQLIARKEWHVLTHSIEDIYVTTWQSVENTLLDDHQSPNLLGNEQYEKYLALLEKHTNKSWLSRDELNTLVELSETEPLFAPAFRLRTQVAVSIYQDTNNTELLQSSNDFLDENSKNFSAYDYLTLKIHIHLALNDFSNAEALLNEFRTVGSSYEYHKLHADMLIRKNSFTEALEQLHILLKARPSTETLYSMAYCQYVLGNLRQAEEALLSLLEMDNDNIRAQSFLASLSMIQGNYELAIKSYETVTKESAHPIDLSNMAVAYMLLHNFDKAEASLEHALSLSPKKSTILIQMGETQIELGNTEKAEFYFHEAIKNTKNTDDIEDYITTGLANIHLGKLDEAKRLIENAKKIEQRNFELGYIDAIYKVKIGDLDAAMLGIKNSMENGYSKEWFSFSWFAPLCIDPEFTSLFVSAGRIAPCNSATKPTAELSK